MHKVVVIDPIASEGIKVLENAGFSVVQLSDRSEGSIMEETADAEGILVRTTSITREIIENAKKLKVIARHGVGYDNIDVSTATEKGIVVTNSPQANTTAVAEHVIGMMVVLAKNMRKADIALREGKFGVRNIYIGEELDGKILGVLGLGRIGRLVAKIAHDGFGMDVIGYDPYISKESLPGYIEFTSDWDDVFKKSDFVTLHLPLLPDTKGIIGFNQLRNMKNDAYFINCARGGVVVESDLVKALETGVIKGAALDVFEEEPATVDNPLFKMEQVVVTPHMAAHSKEAMVKMATHAARGIIEVLSGQKATWAVNKIV
ncbi:MAG: hydroxyacid dehydrogenase [Sphaerochaetaceae bacterium]